MRPRRMQTFVAVLAVVLLTVAGCGDDDAAPGRSPTTTTTPSPSSPEPLPSLPPSPSPSIGGITELVGVPEAGVENNCWLLDDFLLVGGDRKLIASGEEVRVTGQIAKNVMTTCQQGVPFIVDSVEAAE